jgi:large subunit ribosomal protein L4
MELKVTTLDGKEAGKVTLSDEIFGLEPREDILHRMVRYQLAQAPAGHAQGQDPRGNRPHRRQDVQAEGHGRRPSPFGSRSAVPRRRQGPSARWCAATRMTCPRRSARWPEACALGQGQVGEIIVIDGRLPRPRPRRWSQFAKLGLTNALIIGGAELDQNFARRPQHPAHRRAAGAGHQRLRHSAPRHARSDQGRVEALEARFK